MKLIPILLEVAERLAVHSDFETIILNENRMLLEGKVFHCQDRQYSHADETQERPYAILSLFWF